MFYHADELHRIHHHRVLLPENVLLYPGIPSLELKRLQGGQEDVSAGVHRFRLLGSHLLLFPHGGFRPRAHLSQRRQDLRHLRPAPQQLRQPVPVRHLHQAVQEGLLQPV